jgi:uncharacterized protein YndB with AHSA1/START domain
MTSVVEIDIAAPRARVADLFSDPANNPKWMSDIERCEPVNGTLGMPGSTHRLVPKSGNRVFVATVLSKDLPDELRLRLEAPNVVVSIVDRFVATSPEVTRLVSEEEFRFKGVVNSMLGFLAQPAIKKAHRRHMDAFKQFVEHELLRER